MPPDGRQGWLQRVEVPKQCELTERDHHGCTVVFLIELNNHVAHDMDKQCANCKGARRSTQCRWVEEKVESPESMWNLAGGAPPFESHRLPRTSSPRPPPPSFTTKTPRSTPTMTVSCWCCSRCSGAGGCLELSPSPL
ncbi:Os03g0741550 [Oryza sativa Japonica Group]|uniref:Os03g0741550 protein n=1 Tax=Oryza sativa subsp. japonica TaxID=39947 RepID=A0A0P0W2U7_ORYSJ|nr:Os03g0741550 [Oryza sativa Japonica Group]